MKLSILTALFSALAVSATSNVSCSIAPDSTTFPTLGLEFDFHVYVPLNPILNVGNGPWGIRSWISFSGGSWCAKWNNGTTGTIIVSLNNLSHYGSLKTLTDSHSLEDKMPT